MARSGACLLQSGKSLLSRGVITAALEDNASSAEALRNVTNASSSHDYEAKRVELTHACLFGLTVFSAAFLLWLCCPCLSRSPRTRGANDDQDVDYAAPKRNYLAYLLTSAYVFALLTFVHWLALLPHGLSTNLLFGGWSILDAVEQVSVWEIYALCIFDGVVLLASTLLLQRLIEAPPRMTGQDLRRRTVWLEGLPTHDGRRWGHAFEVNDAELNRMASDLSEALTRHINDHRQKLSDTDGPALEASHSSPMSGDAGSGGVPTTTVVEDLQVAVVLDEWQAVHDELVRGREYVEAYTARYNQRKADIQDPETSCVVRFLLWPDRCLCAWKSKKWRTQVEQLEQSLSTIVKGRKRITGSVFVTFAEPRHRDVLLSNVDSDNWLCPSRKSFAFARPPFASVSLTCEPAPHPSDVRWENLHITQFQRQIVFWTLSSGLFLVMVVVVSPVIVMETVMPILHLLKSKLREISETSFWRAYTAYWVQQVIDRERARWIWNTILVQTPSMGLLFINAVILPAIIAWISTVERSATHSAAELRRMSVNFFFLFLNTVLVPWAGASLHELSLVLLRVTDSAHPALFLEHVFFNDPGIFVVKYLVYSTFLTSTNQLLQIPQRCYRGFSLAFTAVTARDRKTMGTPWTFFWGYWYAWTLSIFALGINVSVACPGTLPATAVFFALKYMVDRHNLDGGFYTLDSDIEGKLAIKVILYMRCVVGMWWLTMGSILLVLTIFVPKDHWSYFGSVHTEYAGMALLVLGAAIIGWSWTEAAYKPSDLRADRSDAEKPRSPSHLLEACDNLLHPLAASLDADALGSSSIGTSGGTSDTDAAADHRLASICWDGPKLLGLTAM